MIRNGALLLNLGSPDSPEVTDVRQYLKEFLMDGRVLDAPKPIRWMVVHGFILPRRPKQSAEGYRSIWTDEGSPLIAMSEKTREALDCGQIPVELGMNYRNPTIASALEKLRVRGVNRLFIMPLYPHYAMSSYETALVKARAVMHEIGYEAEVEILQPFYKDPDYIEALHEASRSYLEEPYDLALFSFHGIPERHLRKSDPSHAHCLSDAKCCETAHPAHATCYRHQCFETVRAFTARAGIPRERVMVSFQSRLGRDPWLTPYTDRTLGALPPKGTKRIVVFCPAFVADCLETIEEIDVEGREIFLKAGGESFTRVPCLNDHPAWFDFLRGRIDAFASADAPLPVS